MFKEEKVFCCAILDNNSNLRLKKYCIDNNIPNIVTDFHITFVHTEVSVDIEPLDYVGVIIPSYNIKPTRWKTSDSEIIVLTLNSKWMQYRFQEARYMGAVWDHPEYIPHITLTYDCEDYEIKNISKVDFDLFIESEYCTVN